MLRGRNSEKSYVDWDVAIQELKIGLLIIRMTGKSNIKT